MGIYYMLLFRFESISPHQAGRIQIAKNGEKYSALKSKGFVLHLSKQSCWANGYRTSEYSVA